MEIIEFNEDIAGLQKLVIKMKEITAENVEDLTDGLKVLQKSRTYLTKKGKNLREESNEYSKMVIAKEKELLEIIRPEEERLQGIKLGIERNTRKAWLEDRKQKLISLDDGIEIDDDSLLDMDEKTFDLYGLKRQEDKEQKDWLSKNGFIDDGTFVVKTEGQKVSLYKLVNTYTK